MGIVKAKEITPLQAIRKYCLQCSCGDKNEVDNCVIQGCALYGFRFGDKKKEPEQTEQVHVGDLIDNKGAKVADKPRVTIEMKDEVKVPDEIIEPISKVDTGTGTICGEEPIIAETVTVIKPTKENVVMPKEEAEKHTLKVEPTPSVNGTGKICGENIVFAESKPPIEDGHKFVVELDKVERTEEKPVKKTRAKKVKSEEVKEKPVAKVEEPKKEEKKPVVKKVEEIDSLDDLDIDDLFD